MGVMSDRRPGDAAFRALADEHRRRLLLALQEHDSPDPLELTVLTDDWSATHDSARLQIEFIHRHLPQLEEAGFIHWDRDTQVVSAGPRFGEIEPLLEWIQRSD
jgi:DNA-binding transcriptional ArsR family regulator